jgi:hypothetical protein
MFNAKNPQIFDQQLKVQELVIRKADLHLYSVDSGNSRIEIGEVVLAIVSCLHLDNSGPTCTMVAASALSIITSPATSVALTAIQVASIALDTSDVFVIKYIAAI